MGNNSFEISNQMLLMFNQFRVRGLGSNENMRRRKCSRTQKQTWINQVWGIQIWIDRFSIRFCQIQHVSNVCKFGNLMIICADKITLGIGFRFTFSNFILSWLSLLSTKLITCQTWNVWNSHDQLIRLFFYDASFSSEWRWRRWQNKFLPTSKLSRLRCLMVEFNPIFGKNLKTFVLN